MKKQRNLDAQKKKRMGPRFTRIQKSNHERIS
jgi:hypothetical protein